MVLAAAAAHAAVLDIDPFDAPVGGQLLALASGDAFSYAGPGLDVVGGWRRLELVVQKVNAASFADAQVNGGAVLGRLLLASDPGVDALARLTYDAHGAGLNLNGLLAGKGLAFYGLDNDLAATWSVTLETFGPLGGVMGSSTVSLYRSEFLPSGSEFVSWAEFAGSADFADIDRLILTVDTVEGGGAALEELAVVPEPGAVGWAAGLVCGVTLLVRRFRRRGES